MSEPTETNWPFPTGKKEPTAPAEPAEAPLWLWRVFNQGWPDGHEDSTNQWGAWSVISAGAARRLANDDEGKRQPPTWENTRPKEHQDFVVTEFRSVPDLRVATKEIDVINGPDALFGDFP